MIVVGDDEKKDSKEDLAIKAGFMLVKKELEEKTGQYSSGSKEKKGVNQDDFLKMLRDKKKKVLEIDVDIFTLKHSYNYSDDIDMSAVIEYTKDKAWDNPRDINLLNILGTAYMVSGDYIKAELEYRKATNIDKHNIDVVYNCAELNIRRGNTKEGAEYLSIILKKDKDNLNALYLMAVVFYIRNNHLQSSAVLAQALKTDREFSRVHKNYAFLSLIKKNMEKSTEVIRKLLETDIKNIPARISLQNIFLKEHKYENYFNEEKILENIIKGIETIYAPCVNVNKGVFEALNGGESAEDYFKEACKLNNRCICSMVENGKFLITKKRYTEANELLKKAFQLNPLLKETLAALLKMYYFLKLDSEADDVALKLYNVDKSSVLRIYSNEGTLFSIELEKIKDHFIRNLSALTKKFEDKEINIDIGFDEDFVVYKLFRNIKICEAACNG